MRFFTKIKHTTRAEYSHINVVCGEHYAVILKTKKKPQLNMPGYCIVKKGKDWYFPIDPKLILNKNILWAAKNDHENIRIKS